MVQRIGDTVLDRTVSRSEVVFPACCFRGHIGNVPGLWVTDTTGWCHFFPAEPGRDQGIYDALEVFFLGELPEERFYDMVLPGSFGKGPHR